MKDNVANHFCRLATGAGVRIRKLYKTNDYITFEAIRPIIVNGISQIITQSDLLNRAIPIELSPIEKRITDDEYRDILQSIGPQAYLEECFDRYCKNGKVLTKRIIKVDPYPWLKKIKNRRKNRSRL